MSELTFIGFLGEGLKRPECVLCTSDGRVHASNWDGGVSILPPDGVQVDLVGQAGGLEVKPNGICLMPDGSYLLAHLGAEEGGVFRIDRTGVIRPFLLEVDGVPLPPTNYVHLDAMGRVWITVSTRKMPRSLGYRPDVDDGFVVLVDDGKARIVADGLGYTNECIVHPDGRRLFVNETFARRLSSFDIADDGSLTNKTTVAEFGMGTFPDGLTFDQEGGIWITSIVSNRVIRISPDGEQRVVLEDNDPAHLAWVEAAYLNGTMDRPHLDNCQSERLKNISSLAFGGPDLKRIYLGCLLGDAVAIYESPVAGYAPAHWKF
ncbi:SMP-30/gluconolactonase/LRE family protein [Denitrobaculum tricleocarpae]|uniref:SMP-30/gluconolactonase/LRE family protein n=1 Tax=Denitrobaculum tricleocarpae TaxID=2591009 RepID=A0A545TU59_9PROT|nr:SMP-30/gluconolactonase/LRE family protein [Denitrobaculum tricleocarpae]TQV80752.1 SMP-30/gluconolactonase/LRE family protein [Denitrobaculum tricleocarpae]